MAFQQSLRTLITEIISYIQEDFNKWAYLYFFLYTGILITLNYTFGLYTHFLRPTYFSSNSWWVFGLFYICVYWGAAIPILLIKKEYAILRNWKFYFKSAFFLFLFGFSIGFYEYQNWLQNCERLLNVDVRFLRSAISLFKGIILVVLPLALIRIFFDRQIPGLYGLSKNAQHINVYLAALAFMIPFLILVSYTNDFQNYYPRFKPWLYEDALGLSNCGLAGVYELCYASDFITTEVFFRGAMVIGMTAIMGPRAVLPMAAVYCSIHFGKPIVETCSSIFGGYLLGVLAYQTKHIWGGVIAHIGIAMTIEIMGLLQHYVLH